MNSYKLLIACPKERGELLGQLEDHPDLWNQQRLRTSYIGSPHKEASDIWIRFNDIRNMPYARYMQDELVSNKDMVSYPAMDILTSVRPILSRMMFLVEGERLGRVLITKLEPGKSILPHSDDGGTSLYYDRFHIILAGTSQLCVDTDTRTCKEGEVWWINNQKVHSAFNKGPEDRIHLIVDIRLHEYSPFWNFKNHSITRKILK